MNTAVTIPWGAVVEGCPPSQQQAKALPLVVAEHFRQRSDVCPEGKEFHQLIDQISQIGPDSMAMVSRSGNSTCLEVTLPHAGAVAVLTSDGQTSVILQQATFPPTVCGIIGPVRQRDAFTRTYVARYACFDPDGPEFVVSRFDVVDDGSNRMTTSFLRPESWGFEPTATGFHWTANGLFPPISCPPRSSRPDYAARPRFLDPFSTPEPQRGDPFHCLPQLRQARDFCRRGVDGQTPTAISRLYCYSLALALGRCRQFGVRLADADDCTLTPASALQASLQLKSHVRDAIKRLTNSAWAAKLLGAMRVQNHALELLEARMDAHAAHLALDEAYAAALYDGSSEVPAMSRRLHQVRRLINLFDKNLQKNLPLLRLAASTYLLDNWRRLLAPAFRDLPPWWLDGCIG
jgi:hypothetical protein